jgi:hypothetical protein
MEHVGILLQKRCFCFPTHFVQKTPECSRHLAPANYCLATKELCDTHTPKAKCVPYCNLLRETRKNFVRSLGNFPSAFFPQTLYKPSTSQLCHFSLEDGDKCFTEMLASTSETTRLQNQRQHKHQGPFKFLYQFFLNILRAYRADYSTDLHIQLSKSKIVNCTTEIVKI